MGISISKSRINTFEHCQMQFKFQYIDKVETGETFEMNAGTIYHEWTEKLDKNLKELSNEKIIKDYLENLLINPTRNQWEKYYINCRLEFLTKCLEVKKDKWKEYFNPMFIEFNFEKEIDGNKYRCIIDRVFKSFDDNLILFEIKTGKATLEDIRKEMCLAKIIIDSVLNVDCMYLGIINPNLKIIKTEKIKKVSVTYCKKSIAKLIEAINAGKFEKNTWFCGTCVYSELCYNFTMFR